MCFGSSGVHICLLCGLQLILANVVLLSILRFANLILKTEKIPPKSGKRWQRDEAQKYCNENAHTVTNWSPVNSLRSPCNYTRDESLYLPEGLLRFPAGESAAHWVFVMCSVSAKKLILHHYPDRHVLYSES